MTEDWSKLASWVHGHEYDRHDVVVVCPFYYCYHPQRAEITRRVFRHYAKGDYRFIGVGHEGDLSRNLFCEVFPEENYREYPDEIPPQGASGSPQLHAKSMFALAEARKLDPGFVFVVGSDDIVPLAFLRPFVADFRGFAQGPDGGFYIWRYPTDEYAWVPGDYQHHWEWADITLCAAHMGWKASLLDDFDWWFDWHHGEIGIERDIRARGYEIEEVHGHAPWSIKCDDAALNPWDLWAPVRKPVPTDVVVEFREYWESLSG